LQALADIDYRDYLTFELDAQAATRSGVVPAEDDLPERLMEEAIEHVKGLEAGLRGS
jgi:hypothetical protein